MGRVAVFGTGFDESIQHEAVDIPGGYYQGFSANFQDGEELHRREAIHAGQAEPPYMVAADCSVPPELGTMASAIWIPPAALGPLGVYSLFFKFYDFLAGFKAPPSHIMTRTRAARKFQHLDLDHLKYCSVFYEGMHDDARTNLSIAQTASLYGAACANYTEVVSLLREDAMDAKKVTGVVIEDKLTGERIDVRAKSVVFAGGPFTDSL